MSCFWISAYLSHRQFRGAEHVSNVSGHVAEAPAFAHQSGFHQLPPTTSLGGPWSLLGWDQASNGGGIDKHIIGHMVILHSNTQMLHMVLEY